MTTILACSTAILAILLFVMMFMYYQAERAAFGYLFIENHAMSRCLMVVLEHLRHDTVMQQSNAQGFLMREIEQALRIKR